MITVVVTDNGPGIPPDLVPTIFLDEYTTKARSGIPQRGLGLALVHRTVTRLLRVGRGHGRPDGTGARFLVTIPTRQSEPSVVLGAKGAAQ